MCGVSKRINIVPQLCTAGPACRGWRPKQPIRERCHHDNCKNNIRDIRTNDKTQLVCPTPHCYIHINMCSALKSKIFPSNKWNHNGKKKENRKRKKKGEKAKLVNNLRKKKHLKSPELFKRDPFVCVTNVASFDFVRSTSSPAKNGDWWSRRPQRHEKQDSSYILSHSSS